MNHAAIIFDDTIPEVVFAAGKIREALDSRNTVVRNVPHCDLSGAAEPIRIVLTTLHSAPVNQELEQKDMEPIPTLSPQGYAIRIKHGDDHTLCWVIGADPAGAMYGGLAFADAVNTGENIKQISNHHKNPFISNRGIKFNIPLDARTPSYSDNGDSAQHNIAEMWSMDFWEEFLDEMALHRFNTLSLWNLHPFPSMVQVPEYPDIALQDIKKTTAPIQATLRGLSMSTAASLDQLVTLKKMTIEEKVSFWRQVMQYAKNRGIDVYIITWNIFTYGTEGNRYGIDTEQNNETTIDYFRASVRCLLETYPLLAGIGVTAGENMQHLDEPSYSDEEWLWRTYGEGAMDVKRKNPERNIRFIHRAHETSLTTIDNAFAGYSDTFDYSYKYSLAHMYSSVKPPFIYREGYLADLPKGHKTWLTVRDDDFYYFRWGNPDFARQYILNMPPSDRLAGFFLGPDGIIWGREFVSTEPETPRQSMIKKHGYSFSLWGQLTYDPTIPNQQFEKQLAYRYPEVPEQTLFEAWATVSKVIPLVTAFHWKGNSLDFQWYPEACYSHPERAKGFHTVQHFIDDAPMPESGMMSIPDYCDHLLNNRLMTGITPLQVARDLDYYANRTLQMISEMNKVTEKQLRLILGDLEAMSYLGKYYASKILGAIELCLWHKNADPIHQKQAIENLEAASAHWKVYSTCTAKQYIPQLLTRQGYLSVDLFELQKQVDHDIAIAALQFF
jgi:hypothetical protein